MFSYFVDGHCIGAENIEDATAWFESLYGYTPDIVREWTLEDEDENLLGD